MEHLVKRTGRLVTYAKWQETGNFPAPGDQIDERFYEYLRDVVPPAVMTETTLAVGEPHDHRGPDGAARHTTIDVSRGVYTHVGTIPLRTPVRLIQSWRAEFDRLTTEQKYEAAGVLFGEVDARAKSALPDEDATEVVHILQTAALALLEGRHA